ncbi:hypothetical protein V1264_005356 [Littorina saxatilis]|uniref:Transposase n=1 Tax=Littorina saxatilis TaxID=31220 RepID=A0AAN9AZ06_9CAEN
MPPRRRLSDAARGMAVAWLQEGVAVREVGRRLQVTHSVIQRLRDRFNNTGSVQEPREAARTRMTTWREDRYVIVSALRNRTATANTLRGQVRTATNILVSDQTVRNRLHEVNMRSRRRAVRPPLTRAHRAARLAWTRRHLAWTRQQWSSELFSDESCYTLSFNDGRIRVWRRPRERFSNATVLEHNRHGGGSLMVWGGFSLHHRTPLHRVQGNPTGIAYRDDILRPIATPVLHAIGPGATLQDDNAPAHGARVVNNFLQQQQVIRMDWPSRSPDLNSIEHLWDVLGRLIRANHSPPPNLNVLFHTLQQEWQAIPQNTLQTLVRSMRQRCLDCINANGGHTRY